MPPSEQPLPPQERRHTSRYVLLGVIVAIAVAAFAAVEYYIQRPKPPAQKTSIEIIGDQQAYIFYVFAPVRDAQNRGDYQLALQLAQQLSATTSPDIAALAKITAGNLSYRMSGKFDDLLNAIDLEKEVALDMKVSVSVRVQALNAALVTYFVTGNPTVYNRIYSGPTFADFREGSSTEATSLKAFLWSHQELPTLVSKVFIARGYAIKALNDATSTGRETDIKNAEQYISDANSQTYKAADTETGALIYAWRAFTYGALATLTGGQYIDTYKAAYKDLFTYTDGNPHLKYTYASFGHFLYAYFLVTVDKDTETAKAQLQMAMDIAKGDPNPQSDPFYAFIKSMLKSKPNFFSKSVAAMRSFSPDFETFVQGIQ